MSDRYLFDGCEPNDWREHWVGMPEYDNKDLTTPDMTVTVHFRCKEDFDLFCSVLSDHIPKGQRLIDGRQSKEKKTFWFPPDEKGSNYRYVDG